MLTTPIPRITTTGRLPSADTDKKFLDAVKIHGKDFVGIGSYINKTPEAAQKYWERHCDRLGLEKRVSGAGVENDAEQAIMANHATLTATNATAAPMLSAPIASVPAKKRPREGKIWSEADKKALLEAFTQHGRNWKKLHEAVRVLTFAEVINGLSAVNLTRPRVGVVKET